MKTNKIILIFAGLFLLVLAIVFTPRIVINHYWKKTDEYAKVERYTSALTYALKAKKLSYACRLKPEYVKSLLYEIKFKSILNGNEEEIIKLLQKEKTNATTPVKEIISSLYQEKLWDYAQRRQRQDNKTYIDDCNDISVWSTQRILKEIISEIDSIKHSQKLKFTSFTDYQKTICSSSQNQIAFSSAYEFLTWHSIEILRWTSQFFYGDVIVRNPADSFFVPMEDFLKMKIAVNDTFDVYTASMGLYQDLLKFEKYNFSPETTYEIELQRLNSLKEHIGTQENEKNFVHIVTDYRRTSKNKKVSLFLDYVLLNEYKNMENADEYQKKCFEIINNYPYWKKEVRECKNYLSLLSESSLQITGEDVCSKDKRVEMTVSCRNEDTVYLCLYKLPESTYPPKDTEIKNDSAYKTLTNSCIEKKILIFKKTFAQTVNKKINFKNLNPGTYLVAAGFKKNLKAYMNVEEWQVFKVTDIGSFTYDCNNEIELYAVKRNNGEAIKKACVIVYPKNKKSLSFLTDNMGKVTVNDSLLTGKILIGHLGDTIVYNAGYHYSYNREEDETKDQQIKIFTDRMVYRPLQKIWFKGILTKRNVLHQTYYPISNQTVHIYFNDYQFNYGEAVVTTNVFGSFDGSFQIPAKFPLGQMEITTKYGEQYVQIEEYKRTKMRLTVLPFQKPTSIGDSIVISGYTKYLNGIPARGLHVTFIIDKRVNNSSKFLCSERIAMGKVSSDNSGEFKIKIKTTPLQTDLRNQFEYEYEFHVICKDDFGEIQNGYCNVPVGNNSCKATIKTESFLIKHNGLKIPVEFKYNDNPIVPQQCRLLVYKLNPPQKNDRNGSTLLYQDLENIKFDSLARGNLVFDKTMVHKKDYIFDVNDLNKREQGFYVAEIEAAVNNKINIRQKSGFTLMENSKTGLTLPVESFFVPFLSVAQPGEKARFIAGSALADFNGLFVVTKNDRILYRRWIHLSKNQQILSFPIHELHRGNIWAALISYTNDRFNETSHLIKVPFDNKKLTLSFRSFRKNLYPGEEETWQLQVKDSNGKAADAEMVATLYDGSLDEIMPNEYQYFPYADFEDDETSYSFKTWEFLSCNKIRGRGAPETDRVITNDPSSTNNNFPYFPTINWDMDKKHKGRESFFFRSSRIRDHEKTKVCAEHISYSGLLSEAIDIDVPPPPPPLRSTVKFTPPGITKQMVEEEPGKFSRDNKNSYTRVRKDFRETAFFFPFLRTDSKGSINIPFTMPDALTQWKMWGFAHTKDMKTGSITNELVTQKDFMVIPNWPRFFRSGDTVSLLIRIENNTLKHISGNVLLEVRDATDKVCDLKKILLTPVTQKFLLNGKTDAYVHWRMLIPYGKNALRIKIIAQSGNTSDGEEMMLPVLPDEIQITETMPFFMPGNKSMTVQFPGLVHQSNDIRNNKYVLEFAPNPKWNIITALAYLTSYPYECAEQTFDKYFAFSIAGYLSKNNPILWRFFNRNGKSGNNILSSLESNPDLKSCLIEETPWVFDAKTTSATMQQLSALFNDKAMETKKSELLEKLEDFQNTDGGIAWFKGMSSSDFISFYLLDALGKINKLGLTSDFEQKLPGFLLNLIDYCDKQVLNWYLEDLKRKSGQEPSDPFSLTYCVYARSYFLHDHPLGGQKLEAYTFFIKQIGTNWQKADDDQKPEIALILYRNKDYLHCNQIIESLKERAVQDPEKGMYWVLGKNSTKNYHLLDYHAQVLELFTETFQRSNDLDKLKNWLYLQKKNNSWNSTITTAMVCYSLLMNDKNWFSSMASYKVETGTESFFTNTTTTFQNPSGIFRNSWNASGITKNLGTITITPLNKATSPAWGAAYWQYFRKMKNTKETSSGLHIHKLYFVKQNNSYIPIEKKAPKIGDEITIRLEIIADRNLSYVHLKDLRPACFEPVSRVSGYSYQNGLSFFVSIRDASQNFFIEFLPEGKHLIEYEVRVTHQGFFQTGNASAQCMYSPEYVGYSLSQGITVNN